MNYIFLIITTTFIFICFFFGLKKEYKNLNSPLLNKSVPEINLITLKSENLNKDDFKNEILLVNFLLVGACLVLLNMIFY